MPDYKVTVEDAYLCTAVALPDEPLKLVGIEPLATQETAHHMLLFGCEAPASSEPVWECHMSSPCGSGPDNSISHGEQVMYGWGRNAPGMHLPEGAGFSVGPRSGIRTAVLQVHYQIVRPAGDHSGVRLKLTSVPQPLGAGMMMWASGFIVPKRTPRHLVPNSCCYSGFQPLNGFAFRVHAHALGRQIWMDRLLMGGEAKQLVTQDPQLPQGFYPVGKDLRFVPGDALTVTCAFDSSNRSTDTFAGSGSKNEMCNMYMMTTSEVPYFMTCGNSEADTRLTGPGGFPAGAKLEPELLSRWQPPPPLDSANGKQPVMGQVAGVAAGTEDDTLWVLHRHDRIWANDSFTEDSGFEQISDASTIQADTVLQLDKDTGAVKRSWGNDLLVLPHSIAVDHRDGSVWVTDVGLHQALKFDADGKQLAAIGQRLQPGHDTQHLCKPTAMAFSRVGDVFVADGYCNSRVLQYSANGTFIHEYKLPEDSEEQLQVPHGLVVDDCHNALYVADREAFAVRRFTLWDGSQERQPAQEAAEGETAEASDEFADNRQPSQVFSIDTQMFGAVYGITAGPYGSVLALCWNRDTDDVWLLVLDFVGAGKAVRKWKLKGVKAPHDLTLTAAPLEVTGAGERTLAVYVAETRASGSSLRKFILLSKGLKLQEVAADAKQQPKRAAAKQTADSAADQPQPSSQQQKQGAEGKERHTAARPHQEPTSVVELPAASKELQDLSSESEPLPLMEQPAQPHEGLRGAAARLLLMGLPFAAVFAAIAAVLWWRMGRSRGPAFQPLPTHE